MSPAPLAAATIAPPCGTPAWTASPGALLQSLPLNNEIYHLESCAASAAALPTGTGGGGISVTPLASAPIALSTSSTQWTYSINLGTCFNVVTGVLQINAAVCPTAGPQATPSPTSTGCGAYTGVWPYTDDTTGCVGASTNNTFSGTSTFTGTSSFTNTAAFTSAASVEFNASGSCGSSTTTAEFCILGNSTAGMVIGPNAGSYTTGTGDSQQLVFCKILTNTLNCSAFIKFTSGGTFQFGGASVSTGNQSFTTGTSTVTSSAYLQTGAACSGSGTVTGASGNTACVITCASSAWGFTFGHTFSATPVIEVTDESGGSPTITSKSTTAASGACTTGHVLDVTVRGNST